MDRSAREVEARKRARRTLALRDLASFLDHRVYDLPPGDGEALASACEHAVDVGFGAVVCRPEDVPAAAQALQGTGVPVATALGWHQDDTSPLDTATLLEEARSLAGQGATELALIATRGRLAVADDLFASQAGAVVGELDGAGVRVRAILGTEDLDCDAVAAFCRRARDLGVWMVQAGSWRGERTSLSHIEAMRDALGPEVLLKWTTPVRSMDTLLLCIAEGVSRFNADVDNLMGQARARAWAGIPLTVPLRGVDYDTHPNRQS